MIKRPEQRVVVLIDTQNMYHSAKHLYGAHLNFGRLVEMLVGERNLVRAVAYAATSKGGDERGFLEALRVSGIEVKTKEVLEFSSGERKADWDVGMAIDAVKFSDRVDAVILVTGDGDFVPLVDYLKNKGIMVQAAAFGESTSKQLRESVDEYFNISEHPVELLMVTGRAKRKTPQVSDEGRLKKDDEFETDEEIDDLDLNLDQDKGSKPKDTKTKRRKVRVTV